MAGGLAGIGSIGDYLAQSGPAADVGGSGFGGLFGGGQSGIDLTGVIGGLGGQIPNIAGDVFGQIFGKDASMLIADAGNLAIDIAGDLTLNPISLAKTVLDVATLVTQLMQMFAGVPRALKTQGLIDWFDQQSDPRFQMTANYIQDNILNAGLVISSPATPGHNYAAFMGLLAKFTSPLPFSGQVKTVPVKGTQKGVTFLIPDGHLYTVQELVKDAFGVHLPSDLNPVGAGYLITTSILAGYLHEDFIRGLVTPRGKAIAETIGTLHAGGDQTGISLFIHNVANISTSDIIAGNSRADFTSTGHLSDYCICGETDPTQIADGECLKGMVSNLTNPNNPGNLMNELAGLPNIGGTGGSGGSTSDATGGTSNVNISIAPDAATNALLAEELAAMYPSGGGSGFTTADWVMIGMGFIVLVMAMKGIKH